MIHFCARASSRFVKRKTNHASRFLSTAQTENVDSVADKPSIPYDMLSWGTINKGSIPVKSALEEGKRGGPAANLLNRGGTVLDHPQIINVNEAFGIGELPKRFIVGLFSLFRHYGLNRSHTS